MRGMNRIMVVGRLGQEPELRQGKGGGAWCTFSVATGRHRREGEGWVEETDWHDVKVFGEDAERCQRRLRKGSVVGIDGTLIYDQWTDDSGQRRRKARISAQKVQFLADLKEAAQGESEPTADLDLSEHAEA